MIQNKKEKKIIEYFKEVWKKNAGREYDEISYPFTRQDTWTGKVVMDFAKFILTKEEEKEKEKVEWLLKEIEKEIWKHEKTAESFLNDGNTRAKEWHAGISEGLEIAKDLIKKAFSEVIKECVC